VEEEGVVSGLMIYFADTTIGQPNKGIGWVVRETAQGLE